MSDIDVSKMTECARAYIEEYGSLPANRDEQDRYSTFRFGWEAGVRRGVRSERERMSRWLAVDEA